MELDDILKNAVKLGASDIHIKVGLPPIFRVDGALNPQKDFDRVSSEFVTRTALKIMYKHHKEKFQELNEVDLAYGVPGLGRFRVNVFQQRGTIGLVLRTIPFSVKSLDELNLPAIIQKLCMEMRGLVLVTGTTGSGKSTTLAAIVEYINENRSAHIVTVEDPIEFLLRDKRSIINQREIGVDTNSFSNALRAALRQDPDVIMVGEMRDLETIEIALTAAETGHLVLSTLHTLDATESINRVISVFPPFQQKQVRIQLASVIKGIISQRLVPKADGNGRVPATEVLVSTGRIKECIEDKDKTKEIRDAIGEGYVSYGMQTFDQSLMAHLHKGLITREEAIRQASNPDDFELRLRGISQTSNLSWEDFERS